MDHKFKHTPEVHEYTTVVCVCVCVFELMDPTVHLYNKQIIAITNCSIVNSVDHLDTKIQYYNFHFVKVSDNNMTLNLKLS